MVNVFDTIEILYDREHKDISGYLAEFFKLCGLFVVEKTEDDVFGYDDVQDITGEQQSKAGQEESDSQQNTDIKIAGGRRRGCISVAIDIRDYRGTNVSSLLLNVVNWFFDGDSLMTELCQIYVEQNLFVHNMMERYYYDPVETRVRCSYDAFKNASEQLDTVSISDEWNEIQDQNDSAQLDERKESEESEKSGKLESYAKYFEYFKISCKSKMNNLCDIMKISKAFNTELLINEALHLTGKYDGFYQGLVLAGLIADKDIKYAGLARGYYILAMNSSSEMFKGYIHYRLARYYEKTERDFMTALSECENALNIMPENIRVIYKKGILEYRLGIIGESCRDFLHVCDLLSDALLLNCMEPIEVEYLSKSYTMLHIIYTVWLQEKGNAQIVAELMEDVNQIVDRDVYFDAVFGNDANSERESLKKHIEGRKVDV